MGGPWTVQYKYVSRAEFSVRRRRGGAQTDRQHMDTQVSLQCDSDRRGRDRYTLWSQSPPRGATATGGWPGRWTEQGAHWLANGATTNGGVEAHTHTFPQPSRAVRRRRGAARQMDGACGGPSTSATAIGGLETDGHPAACPWPSRSFFRPYPWPTRVFPTAYTWPSPGIPTATTWTTWHRERKG